MGRSVGRLVGWLVTFQTPADLLLFAADSFMVMSTKQPSATSHEYLRRNDSQRRESWPDGRLMAQLSDAQLVGWNGAEVRLATQANAVEILIAYPSTSLIGNHSG